MKYFYIITFDGQIFELTFTEQKLNSAVDSWKNGGLLVFQELGGGIHANSISKILDEELYESYIYNVKPKLFIKDGTWYDGKERKIVRREKWKQDEIDSRPQLAEEIYTPTEVEQAEILRIRKEISAKYSKL